MLRIIPSRKLGQLYEKQAEHFLKQQGFALLKANYQCRLGEIDLIMQQKQNLIFVEVRYRKTDSYGKAEATVDLKKQQKIIKTAQYFLNHYPQYQLFNCRFDVIGISQEGAQIEWIKNAFTE